MNGIVDYTEFCADFFGEFEVESTSDSDEWHLVTWHGFDASCSCPGFKFRGECKHIGIVWHKGCFKHLFYPGGTKELRPRNIRKEVASNPCPGCGGSSILARVVL